MYKLTCAFLSKYLNNWVIISVNSGQKTPYYLNSLCDVSNIVRLMNHVLYLPLKPYINRNKEQNIHFVNVL